MADYTPQIQRARQSVTAKGRLVTLSRIATGVSPSDPLAGPSSDPVRVSNVPAVFVPPSSASQLGYGVSDLNLFKNCTQIAIVATVDGHDFTTFDRLIEANNEEWKIEYVEALRPATHTILYFIGVRRP